MLPSVCFFRLPYFHALTRCELRASNATRTPYAHVDLIPFFGPLMMRETGPRQLVDGPVLVSDTLDYCVVVVHYSADATAQ